MSEVASNSSAEEIQPEEIEEIQMNEDEETSNITEATHTPAVDNADDDPPVEIMSATPAPPTEAPAAAPAEANDPPVVDPPAEPVAAESEAQAPQVAAQAEAAVTLENVADVEEVPREPPVEPPVARAPIQGLAVSGGGDDADDDEDDDDIDETLTERLVGLTEMFPDCVRNGTVSLVKGSWSATKTMYGFSRSAAWIFFSTASILIMPVMIETERLSISDQQKQQKTQMLLGPGVAGSGGAPSLGPPPI